MIVQSAWPGGDEDNEGVMMIVMIMRRTMMWMVETVIEMTVIVSETGHFSPRFFAGGKVLLFRDVLLLLERRMTMMTRLCSLILVLLMMPMVENMC